MIRNDYAYDLINQPYLSEMIDPDSGLIVQSLKIPPGVNQIRGLRVKLSKFGQPGAVWVALGRSSGSGDLAQGEISPNQILPVFELWTGIDFAPVSVAPGETCYLSLRVLDGKKPLDAYRLYGPNIYDHTGSPESARLPYWWRENLESTDDLDIPLPYDYNGAAYPDYPDGQRLSPDGSRTWSISFLILTAEDEPPQPAEEQRFEFAQRLLAPPFSEWQNMRNLQAQAGPDTVEINDAWEIGWEKDSSPVIQNAVTELREFCERVMGLRLAEANGKAFIRLELRSDGKIPAGDESFSASIRQGEICLTARKDRGLLRAVHWLEDTMLLARAPWFEPGEYTVRMKYSPRMVPAIYPAPAYYQLLDAEIWTPGYMWRLSRAGYNAIYLPTSMEDFVEQSAIFPEMNDPQAGIAIERLRRITELGAAYGVDVYINLGTGYSRKFSESIYKRLPEIRAYEHFGNYPCSGQQIVLDFYKETLAHVFLKAENLKGIIVIYDTEGFFSCFIHNLQSRCPHCKDSSAAELSTRLFAALREGIHSRRADTELILWSYFCDEPWNYEVIRAMPADATLMACYSQFVELERFGVRIRTDDYSICSEKPSANFLKLQELAQEKGLRFLCKTEDTFGQEFVSTPYTPCLEQHQRRWDELAKQHVDGCLAQYIHIGFMPGPCADLMRQNVLEVAKDRNTLDTSAELKLRRVAAVQYGEAAVSPVVSAWKSFSTAIRDYFPYTWGVCRYPGPLQSAPAQPFYLDPNRRVPRPRSRGFVKDLRWTGIDRRFLVDPAQTWDAALVSRCFQAFMQHYTVGIQRLVEARKEVEPACQEALEAAIRVAQTQALQVRSLLNLVQFFQLREAYHQTRDRVLREALIYICQAEKENAIQALQICRQDSLIGFTCEGAGNVRGGSFTPTAIEQKIAGLEETLRELYG